MSEKKCSRCKRHLSLDNFGKNKSSSDGLNRYCRPCANERNRESKRRIFERSVSVCKVCGVKVSPGGTKCKKHGQVGAARGRRWKGGRVTRNGYSYIWEPEHPNASKEGYVPEHRKVMSDHLGRPLTSDESVHHKNGQRDDNRLENLELWSRFQPTGQRVEDLVAWAQEILKQYPEFLQE